MCIQLVILWSVDNLPFHRSHSVPLTLPGLFEFLSNRIMSCSFGRPVWEQRNAPNKPTRGRPHWTRLNYRDRFKENSWLLYFMRHHVVRECEFSNLLVRMDRFWQRWLRQTDSQTQSVPSQGSAGELCSARNCWCKWFLWRPGVEECAFFEGGICQKAFCFSA